jgi:ketosteroid isomerase-like protein
MTGHAEHPNVQLLRTLYDDLTRIAEYAADDNITYHLADRDLPGSPGTLTGRAALAANERAFVEATGATLAPAIEHITANDYFGTVTGTFHATVDGEPWTMAFCGLWRFRNGRITDHWQNAYQPAHAANLFRRATTVHPEAP